MEPVNKKIKVGNATSGDDNGPESFLLPVAVITIPTKTYDRWRNSAEKPKYAREQT